MKKILTLNILIIFAFACNAQPPAHAVLPEGYLDSLQEFRLNYVRTHEVVKGDDKKYFRFFKISPHYYTIADFKRTVDTVGFLMRTSGKKTPRYFRYGTITFSIGKSQHSLTVYQGEDTRGMKEYAEYLFVPYTDLTSGGPSYGGGKYLEFYISDIIDNKVIIDFNKAYNPYCAYTTGYNCPVPPRENHLNIAIRAGEKEFGKH